MKKRKKPKTDAAPAIRARQRAQKPARDRAESGTMVVDESRAELLDELLKAATTRKVTGTHSEDVADRIIVQAAGALVWPKPKGDSERVIKGIYAIEELAPRNATEAMLAVQMIAVNDAAQLFLSRATLGGQTGEAVELNVLCATRLLRVFNEQLEAMQKLKGKAGQQRVTVEHVHVHEGGQAIVGAVSTSKAEGGGGKADGERITP